VSNLSIDPSLSSLSSSLLNLSQVNATLSVTGVQGVQGVQVAPPGAQAIGSDADGDGGVSPAATTSISRQGQLFNQLQQLESQDPAKFKQVLTDVANKLTAAAQAATGKDQQFLTNLADKFTRAASGDLSALQPPSQSAPNTAASAYQQGAQTTLDGQALNSLAQAAGQNGSNGQSQSGGNGASGGHHHHNHGGHGHLSAGTQQTLQSVFQELNSAVGGSGSTTSSTTPPPASTSGR
jgi:hypothetical protein